MQAGRASGWRRSRALEAAGRALVGYAQLPRLVVPDYGRAAAVGADELDAALQGGQRPVGHGVARRRGPVQLGASDGHATPRQAPLLNFICPGHRRRGLRPHPGRLSANSLRRLRARRMGPSRCSPQHSATTPQPTRRSPQGPWPTRWSSRRSSPSASVPAVGYAASSSSPCRRPSPSRARRRSSHRLLPSSEALLFRPSQAEPLRIRYPREAPRRPSRSPPVSGSPRLPLPRPFRRRPPRLRKYIAYELGYRPVHRRPAYGDRAPPLRNPTSSSATR